MVAQEQLSNCKAAYDQLQVTSAQLLHQLEDTVKRQKQEAEDRENANRQTLSHLRLNLERLREPVRIQMMLLPYLALQSAEDNHVEGTNQGALLQTRVRALAQERNILKVSFMLFILLFILMYVQKYLVRATEEQLHDARAREHDLLMKLAKGKAGLRVKASYNKKLKTQRAKVGALERRLQALNPGLEASETGANTTRLSGKDRRGLKTEGFQRPTQASLARSTAESRRRHKPANKTTVWR